MQQRRTNIRKIGLQNHLGEERYNKFVEALELGVPLSVIGRTILHCSRQQVHRYREVYNQEQGLTK